MSRLVVVNTKRPDDQTLRGLRTSWPWSRHILLRAPSRLVPTGPDTQTWVRIDGDIEIPKGAISWTQRVPAEASWTAPEPRQVVERT